MVGPVQGPDPYFYKGPEHRQWPSGKWSGANKVLETGTEEAWADGIPTNNVLLLHHQCHGMGANTFLAANETQCLVGGGFDAHGIEFNTQ